MNLHIRSRLHRYGAISLIIIIVFYLVSASAGGWLSYTYAGDPPPGGLKDAIVLEGDNSDFYFLLGQYYDNHDFTAPRSEVFNCYRKALELNPLNYSYWFYLAEFFSREGERDKAMFALKQATGLSPGVVALRWGAGMLASKLGDREAILDNLRAVIASDPQRRERAFIVLWQSLRNGDDILNMVPDQAVPDYINFLLNTKRITEAHKAWTMHKGLVNSSIYMRMISSLIYGDEIELAKSAWTDRMGDWNGFVWNGDFEEKIESDGFDWMIIDKPGIDIARVKDGAGHTVKIEFDGKEDYAFDHFRQVVPVKENTQYRFSSDIKTADITTRNGVYWETFCLHKKGMYETSVSTYGTTGWHSAWFSFTTPAGCDSIILKLKRDKSDIYDRPFSGTIWIDNVVLEEEN